MIPFFSIIVCVYNVENYIEECLTSIRNQSLVDFECIMVDDGSSDGSSEICKAFAETDSRFIYIWKENGGAASARKTGAQNVSGKFVVQVDNDDWIEPDFLEKMKQDIEKYQVDICRSAVDMEFVGESVRMRELYRSGYFNRSQMEKEIYPFLYEAEDGKYIRQTIWGSAIKSELYKEAQQAVDSDITLAEDKVVFAPCMIKANAFYYEENAVYHYRQRASSMTRFKGARFSWICADKLYELLSQYEDTLPNGKEQLARFLVHTYFSLAVFAFNEDTSYSEIRREIRNELSLYGRKARIVEVKYSLKYWKGILSSFSMRHGIVFFAFLYNRYNHINVHDSNRYYI